MNKGFQALPEYVQRKIDPEMAKQYYGGGSVMQRPLFRQMGGPAAPPMMSMEQPQVNPEQVAQVQGMEDLAMGQGQELGQAYASEMITNIDGADDAKGLIDAFRGNEKPLEARYTELAGFVGEADAQQTPESVLAMVQPTIMMTEEGAVDSGIGELMQSLVQDVGMAEGEQMSQGVGELMAMGAGNTPPVNFNQGGAVRHYAPGGAVTERATTMLPEFQNLYASVLGDPTQRQAELDEQKRLTQAQMLFDIAQAGLQFAGTTKGNSIAERLANAAAESQVFPRIGERAAGQLQAKQALEAEKRQMDLAALQSSISQASTDKAAADDLELATAKTGTDTDYKRVVGSDGKDLGTFNVNNIARAKAFENVLEANPGSRAFNLGTEPKTDKTDFKTVTLYPVDGKSEPITMPLSSQDEFEAIIKKTTDGGYTEDATAYNTRIADEAKIKEEQRGTKTETLYSLTDSSKAPKSFNVKDPKQKKEYDDLLASNNWTADSKAYDIALAEKVEKTQYDRNRLDYQEDLTAQVERDIAEEERKIGYALDKEGRDRVEFGRRLAAETNLQIEAERRALKRDLTREERENAEYRARLGVQEQMKISAENRAIENRDNVEIRTIDNQIVAINKVTKEKVVLFGTPSVPDPEYKEITLPSADGTLITTVVDITSPQGKQAIALVNEVSLEGGQASMRNVPTANISPRGFYIPEEGVFTSYDGGQTYVDAGGNIKSVPGGAFEVSNTIAYDVSKNEKIRANALSQLADMDINISSGVVDQNGKPLDSAGQKEVVNAYEAARNGTGFWAKILAGVDSVVGGVTGGKLSVRIDKQDARQFVRMVRVLGRSSLAASPRFAVADLQTTEQLFPNEQSLVANPETEARKLISLKSAINEEKTRILTLFASGTPVDSSMRKTLNQKLFEIERLNQMLGSVDGIFSSELTSEAVQNAKDLIKSNVVKRGDRKK